MLKDANIEKTAKLYIAGNKSDLITLQQYPENIIDFAKNIQASLYQISARNNIGINELFLTIAENSSDVPLNSKRISLVSARNSLAKKKKSKCC